MIFSKDLLFIHVPKTGGMSVTKYLLETLPRSVYYLHPPHDEVIRQDGVVEIVGNRHLSLTAARNLVLQYGFEISNFRLVLAVIRNPYALEVSRYAYLQTFHPWDAGQNQELALTSDFETFAIKSSVQGGTPIEDYFLLDGGIPKNMRIVRFENLADAIRDALRDVGIECVADLPYVNQSRHGDFRSYYTKAAEEAVYRRYRWVFDNGLYERLDVEKCREFATHHVHRLPITGPVRQVGTSFGFLSDGWVGRTLEFKVTAEQALARMSIQGWIPDRYETPVNFAAAVNGNELRASFEGGHSFKWDLGCNVPPGGSVAVTLSSSDTWCPKEAGGSEDERELSFCLTTIAFGR